MSMQVCYVANPSWPHVEKWARWFTARSDVELHIVSEERPLFDVEWHPFTSCYTHFPGFWLAGSVLEYRRLFNRIKPDLVHLHNLEEGVVPAALAWDGPMVVTTYGLDVVRFAEVSPHLRQRASKRYVLRKADVVTSASAFLADVTASSGRIPREKVRVTPFGVDTGWFNPTEERLHDRPFTMGLPKDFKAEYGVLDFVRAFSILFQKYCDIQGIMVGEGPLRDEVEVLIAELGLGDALSVRGRVPMNEMKSLFEEFDVCVMPSLHESFGVASLEAQSMELPVVASDVEGLKEVLVEGETGFFTPPSNPFEVARAVERFILEPGLGPSMGKAGRRFVKEHFEWEHCAEIMKGIYTECVESAGGAR